MLKLWRLAEEYQLKKAAQTQRPSNKRPFCHQSFSLLLISSSSSICAAGHPANGLISWIKCSAEEMSGSLTAVWLSGREVKGWRRVYWTFSLSPLSKCHAGTISVCSAGGRFMRRTEGEISSPSLMDPATPRRSCTLNQHDTFEVQWEESSLPVSEGAAQCWSVQGF